MPRLFLYYLIWHLLHSVFHKWHIPTCRLFLQGHLCCLGRHEGILSSDNLSILLYKRHCIAVRLNEGLKRQYRILSIGIYNLTYQEYSPCEFYSLFIYINIINRIFTFFSLPPNIPKTVLVYADISTFSNSAVPSRSESVRETLSILSTL